MLEESRHDPRRGRELHPRARRPCPRSPQRAALPVALTLAAALLGGERRTLAHHTAAASALRWRAPPACPDEAALKARIEALIAAPLESTGALAIDVEVRPIGAILRATIDLRQGDLARVREVDAANCDAIVDAVALIIALALDADADPHTDASRSPAPATWNTSSPRQPSASDLSNSASAPTHIPPAQAPRPASPPALGELALAFVGASGLLPGLAPGLRGALGLRRGRLRAAVIGAYLPPRALDLAPSAAQARLDLGWVELRACALFAARTAELSLCGALAAGILRGRASGLERARPRALPWLGPQIGGQLGLPLSRWARVEIGLDLLTPLVRPGFTVEPDGLIFRSAAVAALLHAGVGLHLPIRKLKPLRQRTELPAAPPQADLKPTQ